jgi:Flp pilus assembly pilin Flp
MEMQMRLLELARDEEGVATVEYALLLSLVVVGTLVAWRTLGLTIRNVLEQSADQISSGAH